MVESEGYFCDTEEEYDDQFDAIDRDTQLFDHLYNEIVTELKREKSLNYHRGYDQHKHIHDSYGSVIACFDRSALFKVKDADERPWLIVGYQHEDKELPIVLSAQLLDEDAG